MKSMEFTTTSGTEWSVKPCNGGYWVARSHDGCWTDVNHAIEVAGGDIGSPLVIIWARSAGGPGDTVRASQTVTSPVVSRGAL